MKKSILELGKVLTKVEQKKISGGLSHSSCCEWCWGGDGTYCADWGEINKTCKYSRGCDSAGY
ncbi:hypothetical protein SAMN04487910_3522 [Aquimarina amphilecti]|uniref:Uncharacterized protein n=1 Tax=Aquimarina amphilecti TaxID=1038014 RepID=A0A1H7TMZ0_AQUAM|nr:hypothetical protein [Aquimarina amphilecti]SEL86242.1 hypothetical protein SAMN04487910_3522 [Aquimarina amphilecti]